MNIGFAVAAVLGAITLAISMKLMGLVSENNGLRENLISALREAKKVQEQLEAKSSKYQQKANEASKKGTTAKGQKQRIAQLSDELHAAKAVSTKAQEQVKEFSGEINRLRIEREDLRLELTNAKARAQVTTMAPESEPATQSADGSNDVAARPVEDAPTAEPIPQTPKKQSLGRLERDLERAQQDLEKVRESHKALRRRLVEQTSESRLFKRKNEHNRRAYMITQLQLDLIQDENYVLKHGHPPPYSQSDKQGKRAALRPEEEVIRPDLDAAPIELPDIPEFEEEFVMPVPSSHENSQEEISREEQADGTDNESVEALAPQEEGSEAIEDVSSDESTEQSEVGDDEAMMATDGNEETTEIEDGDEPQKLGTVKRRRKSKMQSDALDASPLASEAPPRPMAE